MVDVEEDGVHDDDDDDVEEDASWQQKRGTDDEDDDNFLVGWCRAGRWFAGSCGRSLQSLDRVARVRRALRAKPAGAANGAKPQTGWICSTASTWRYGSTGREKTAVSTSSGTKHRINYLSCINDL